jgi:hypothetical protein
MLRIIQLGVAVKKLGIYYAYWTHDWEAGADAALRRIGYAGHIAMEALQFTRGFMK